MHASSLSARRLLALLSLSAATAPLGAASASLDFETSGQFSSNFRVLSRLPTYGDANYIQTNLGASANDFLKIDANVAFQNNTAVLLFDQTASDSGYTTETTLPTSSPITVSLQARSATSDAAIGVIFADPVNPAKNITALFNLRAGADLVRFYKNGEFSSIDPALGTQVGSSTSVSSSAEPGTAFHTISVQLSVSGTTPTLTVTTPGGTQVVSGFAAGDIDWTRTTVLLRLTDANTAKDNTLDLDNLTISSSSAFGAPAARAALPAPAAGVNLLAVNPGFEAVSFATALNGDHFFRGWTGKHTAFNNFQVATGSTAAGSTTEGTRRFRIEWGGNLQTAPAARAAALPGRVHEFSIDLRTTRLDFPGDWNGTRLFLDYFDDMGRVIKTYWGPDWRPQQQFAATAPWTTYTVRGLAPAGTHSAGVRIESPLGSSNYGQNRHIELDNARLVLRAELHDRVAVRRAPRLVEGGKSAALRIHYATTTTGRHLGARLIDANGVVRATATTALPSGRGLASLSVPIPAGLPDGDYAWQIAVLPSASNWSGALASRLVYDVSADSSVSLSTATNGTDFDSDHPDLVFMGRIDDSNPKRRWLHWFGSEVRVRFTGTSLALRGGVGENPDAAGLAYPVKIRVIVNDNESTTVEKTLNAFNFTEPLVTGLPDGVHTVKIFKVGETDQRLRVDGFRTDAGRGLLKAEPLPNRRVEIYGDSVTNGGEAQPNYFAYAPLLGRELDLDTRIIGKGGSGIGTSFNQFVDILLNYYDNLSFPKVANASVGSTAWDFARWRPDTVIVAAGHNDLFNGGGVFPARYATFKTNLRAAYPNIPLISMNTIISAPHVNFSQAIEPLIANDPLHTFAFQWNTDSSVYAHPSTAGHNSMVYGNAQRFSVADLVEARLGWGLPAPDAPRQADEFPTLAAPNLVPNGDFESDLSGWTNMNGTAAIVTDGGSKAMRTGLNQGGVSRYVNIPQGAATLTLRFRARSTTNQASTVNLTFVNDSWVQVGSTATRKVFGSPTAVWSAQTLGPITLPSGATRVQVWCWGAADNHLFLDDLVLEAGY